MHIMDIIAAHQQGLIEKLAEEALALAGRPKDFGQRAVVFHHVYDHSRGQHQWALAEARRELRIAEALEALRRRVSRWGWLASRRKRARLALEALADALGEQARERCVAAYTAYRLAGARSLRDEAERSLPGALLDTLTACHAARRSGAAMSDGVARGVRPGTRRVRACRLSLAFQDNRCTMTPPGRRGPWTSSS